MLTDRQITILAWIQSGPPEAVDALDIVDYLGGTSQAEATSDLCALETAGYLVQNEPPTGAYLPLSDDERMVAAG